MHRAMVGLPPRSSLPFRVARACALVAACAGLAASAWGQDSAHPARERRFVVAGPAGAIDLTAAPRASREFRAEAPRFMRHRVVIVTEGDLTPAHRERISALGGGPARALGNGSYTVAIAPDRVAELEREPWVRSVAWFRPEWKVAPDLGRRVFDDPERRTLADRGMSRVQVHLFADAAAPEVIAVRDAISDLPGAVVYATSVIGSSTMISADVARADFEAIAGIPSVQFVEPAPEITFRNNTARGVVQSNTPGNVPLHNAGLTGLGQTIAVCDSGLDTAHCAFIGVGKLVAFNGAPNVTDHGTHVACIAAGDAVVAGDLRGHAYQAGLVFSRTPAFTFDQLGDVFEIQASQGAFVHSNSWGDDNATIYTGMCRSIDDFMHADEDQLVVFAATNQTLLRTPENSKNALSVAAVNDSPNQDFYCSGGFGLTSDDRLKPDVAAPGCSITSADGLTACSTRTTSGTSMATPAVSATAVLLRQYFTEGRYPTGTPTPSDAFVPSGALLKAMLINSATGVVGVPDLPASENSFRAWGRILSDDVAYLPGDTRRTCVVDVRNADGLVSGGFFEVPVLVTGSAELLKITLTWTDPPPAPGIQTALVNDLNLTVTAPNATAYLGNNFTGGVSAPGGAADTRNNVEQVHISAPDPGVWTVRIDASSIPEGTQGFALVVTGEIDPGVVPLTVSSIDPPSTIAPGAAAPTFQVRIAEGSDTLVPGSPSLHYRYAGPTFSTKPLAPLGGDLYEAELPKASCGHTPEFYVSAEGAVSGIVASPITGLSGARTAAVGTSTTSEIFSEDFETGIPGDWTISGAPAEWNPPDDPGPWYATSGCSGGGGCTGSTWAYCGNPNTCTYDGAGTVNASLFTPAINLPAIGPNERLRLVFCTAMSNENASRYDRGIVRIAGLDLDETPHTDGAWITREVDLSGFAGQSVQLEFWFNTFDTFSNAFGGWKIDSIAVERTTFACVEPCPGDLNASGTVDAADFTILAGSFGLQPNATRSEGDLNADGKVDAQDFVIFAGVFGTECD